MKTNYRLNGKEISAYEFYMTFQGMVSWIEAQVKDALDEGKPIPMFNTHRGPLVITVKEG